MNRHDYAQEVGMKSAQPRVSLGLALVVIAVLVVAAWYAVRRFAPVYHDDEPKKSAVLVFEHPHLPT